MCSPECMTHRGEWRKEKEKEGESGWTHGGPVACGGGYGGYMSAFSSEDICVSFFSSLVFLCQNMVRVTMGRCLSLALALSLSPPFLSLSLSLSHLRPRGLAKGNYQLTDQQAGLGRLVIG